MNVSSADGHRVKVTVTLFLLSN